MPLGALVQVKLWIAGLVFSAIGGAIGTGFFLYALRGAMSLGAKPKPSVPRVPPWVTGIVERVVFCTLVGLDVPGAATAMMAWLALKARHELESEGHGVKSEGSAIRFYCSARGLSFYALCCPRRHGVSRKPMVEVHRRHLTN